MSRLAQLPRHVSRPHRSRDPSASPPATQHRRHFVWAIRWGVYPGMARSGCRQHYVGGGGAQWATCSTNSRREWTTPYRVQLLPPPLSPRAAFAFISYLAIKSAIVKRALVRFMCGSGLGHCSRRRRRSLASGNSATRFVWSDPGGPSCLPISLP